MMELIGGIIIGFAVSIFLIFNGRVAGISGIVSGLINFSNTDKTWRLFFVLGLLCGGFIFKMLNPEVFNYPLKEIHYYIIAGLIVGFGTVLGSGCTSGHGVCGISRFSLRSIIATVVFILSGALTVFLIRLMERL